MAVVLLSCAVGACGDGSGETARPRETGTTAPETKPPVTEGQLQAALLTVADLPTGYAAQPSDEEDDDIPLDDCAKRFEALDTPDTAPRRTAEAEATFNQGGAFGTSLGQGLSAYTSAEQARGRLNRVRELVQQCRSFRYRGEDGGTTTATVSELPFPKLGDDTLGLAVKIRAKGGAEVTFNAAYTVVGRLQQAIFVAGVGRVEVETLESAARRGLEKLEAVQ